MKSCLWGHKLESQPWIEGSLEVFELSIEQYRLSLNRTTDRDSNRYSRACLINCDDAVELSVRGFIEFTCGQKSKSFFENLNWLGECDRLDEKLLKKIDGKIRYYHQQRDTLYHQGYSLNISRLDLLDFLSKVYTLVQMLFPVEVEDALQYNSQRAFLILYIQLEKMVVNICEQNGPKMNEDFEMSELAELLFRKGTINENTKQVLNDVSDFMNKIVPPSKYDELRSEVYEVVQQITECLKELTNIRSKKI